MFGQMNLFDYLDEQAKPEFLLHEGQKVYVVNRGEAEIYIVDSEKPWTVSGNTFYRLRHPNGTYGVAKADDIGQSLFFDRAKAKAAAECYLAAHDVIRAEDIHPVKTTCYQYRRNCDRNIMSAFYSELEDGMLYLKGFMTFAHIAKAGNRKKALDEFMKQDAFKTCSPWEAEKVHVTYRNMYKCSRQENGWDYAEAGYNLAVG